VIKQKKQKDFRQTMGEASKPLGRPRFCGTKQTIQRPEYEHEQKTNKVRRLPAAAGG